MRTALLLMAILFAVPGDAPPDFPTGPILFWSDTVQEHLIGDKPVAEGTGKDLGFDVDVRVIVAPDGQVREARIVDPDRYGSMDAQPVLQAARALRFKPFTYRGTPVAGGGTISIRYVSRETSGWRDAQAELPPIDYSSLKITLTRSACYGSCPDYDVTIDGLGKVTFSTRDDSLPGVAEVHRAYSSWNGVLVSGTHQADIDRTALDALIAKFRAAHFFGLRPEYVASVTDNPTYQLIFETGGKRWTVTDYVGEDVGMPAAVRELEDAVDATAGTTRWIHGNGDTASNLLRDGLDVRSDAAVEFARMAALEADERVVLGLMDAGLPLEREVRGVGGPEPLGRQMLETAVDAGQARLFAALVAKGWLARLPKSERDLLLLRSGEGCNLEIGRALIAAGANPNAVEVTAADSLVSRGTLLRNAAGSYHCANAEQRRAMVMGMIAAGADINVRNAGGEGVLFGLEDPELLDRLLDAGARIDFKDKDGNSAAFGSWTDAIVLRLLDAGADPHGWYDDGGKKTMRQMSRARGMPATLAWLDAHRIP